MLSENVLCRADRSNGEDDLCPSLTLSQSAVDPTCGVNIFRSPMR